VKTEEDIGILFNFLDQFGPEAAGRGIAQPQADTAALDRFMQGKCDPTERQAICDMLRRHPSWLRWLSDRVKMDRVLRTSAKPI